MGEFSKLENMLLNEHRLDFVIIGIYSVNAF